MNHITAEQNGQFYLDRLAAQRHLYTQCKRINGVHFLISVLAVIALALIKLFSDLSADLLNWIALYSIVAAVANPLLTRFVASKQLLAAKIQQWFDTDLFKLDWDEALCGKRPEAGDVQRTMKGQKKDGLKNWYVPDSISQLKHENGVLVCMKENVYYDKRLRARFMWICVFLSVVCLIAIAAIALTNNCSTWDVVLKEILPLLPLYNWMHSAIKQNCGNIRQLDNVQTHIVGLMEKATSGLAITKEELNKMQNFIYVHRRDCYVIPDTLYSIMRKGMEQEVEYDINELIRKLS